MMTDLELTCWAALVCQVARKQKMMKVYNLLRQVVLRMAPVVSIGNYGRREPDKEWKFPPLCEVVVGFHDVDVRMKYVQYVDEELTKRVQECFETSKKVFSIAGFISAIEKIKEAGWRPLQQWEKEGCRSCAEYVCREYHRRERQKKDAGKGGWYYDEDFIFDAWE